MTVRAVLTVAAAGAALLFGLGRGLELVLADAPTGAAVQPARRVDSPPPAGDVLGTIVTGIARRPARAACDYSAPELKGYVRTWDGKPEAVVHLSRDICSNLDRFRRFGLTPVDRRCVEQDAGDCGPLVAETIQGIHVIAHESYHVAGVREEAAADCYALQAFGWVARRLGAEPGFSRALLRYYWARYAPLRNPSGEYWSDDCRSGGRLDLGDDEPPWAA